MINLRHPNHKYWKRLLKPAAQGCLCVALAAGIPVNSHAQNTVPGDGSASLTAEDHLRHAETWHWLGMAEGGNMRAFSRGTEEVQAGLSLLKGRVADDDHGLRARLEALGRDLNEQADLTHDTLYGVFPVVRLLGPSIFLDPQVSGTFELIDDPAVVAATTAAASLAESLELFAGREGQLPVVFATSPSDKALENEVRYVFNKHPNFFVSPESDLANIPDLGRQFGPDDLPALAQHLGVGKLMLVTIEKADVVPEGVQFYRLKADFHGVAQSTDSSAIAFGFSRDRRTDLIPIVWWHLSLLLLGLSVFSFVRYRREGIWGLDATGLATGIMVFLLGRILCYPLIRIMQTVMPPPETLVVTSAWWPMVLGAALLSAPWLVLRLSSNRLKLPLSITANWDGVAVMGTLGAVSYFATPAVLWSEGKAGAILLPFALGSAACAWFAGRVLLGRHSEWMLLFPILASGLICVSLLNSSPVWTTLTVGLALGTFVPLIIRSERRAPSNRSMEISGAGITESVGKTEPGTLLQPAFQPTEHFEGIRSKCLKGGAEGRGTVWLPLVGPAGSGKTACCLELLRAITGSRNRCIILRGNCGSEPGAGAAPYTPFRQALADLFDVGMFEEKGPESGICDALGPIMDVIPFMNLIPAASARDDRPSSRDEAFKAVMRLLRRRASDARVVVWIENWQNRDAVSAELCKFLHNHLPSGGADDIVFIIEGRSRDVVRSDGFTDDEIVELPPPDIQHLKRILIQGMSFDAESADLLADYLNTASGGRGRAFWLVEVVKHLRKEGALEESDGFWRIAACYRGKGNFLPLPADLTDLIQEQVKSIDAHRSLLECAACLGERFSATVLAKALRRDRLDVLRTLNDIEAASGMIRDVREEDDVFAFSSELLLAQVRGILSISFRGPRDSSVPQIIREQHARVAGILADAAAERPSDVFAAARHFHAAGRSHATSGVEWCRKACHAAKEIFDWDGAETFLEMAKECAEAGRTGQSLHWDQLDVRLERAHVTGIGSEQVAQDGYTCWKDDMPSEVRLKILRACYDAGRSTPEFNQKLLELADDPTIQSLEDALHRAEARQFASLALKGKNSTKVIAGLRGALALAEEAPDSQRRSALLARICDSLANQLVWDTPSDQNPPAETLDLYRRSIEEKSTMSPTDLPGLARSHGGMARALLMRPIPDLQAARHHAGENWRISVKIGDEIGVSMMKSLLGRCALLEADITQDASQKRHCLRMAADHYRDAWTAAGGHPFNSAYAACGILRAAQQLRDLELAESVKDWLLDALDQEGRVQEFLVRELVTDVAKWSEDEDAPRWIATLRGKIDNRIS